MSNDDIAGLSAEIDIEALKKYRIAVVRKTRDMVKKLRKNDFYKKVDPNRICRIY
jgi:hypothetical protein